MPSFLVDEDLPRSLVAALQAVGIEAQDVRDAVLRGKSDDEIFKHAVGKGIALLSGDLGFANLLRYALGSHAGIVVTRFPNEMPTSSLNQAIATALSDLSDGDVAGNLIIIEPGRIRRRTKD